MEIVISGYYGFDNVGDEAILYSIIHELKNNLPSISITVLSNKPEHTSKLYDVNAVNRWNIKAVWDAVRQSDGVISGGGGLLQDKTGMTTISYYCAIMWMAYISGKPFFVYSQGIGPINKKFNKKIVSLTLKRAALITVRDEQSKSLVHQLGIKNQVSVVVDPVLGMDLEEMNTSNWLNQNLKEDDFLTVSVRYTSNSQAVLTKIAKGLSPIAEKGKKLVFIPMFGKEDHQCSKEVKQMMSTEAQQHTYVAPYYLSIHEKAAIIGSSQLLIGMRLHSLIFAVKRHTPFLAISYDPKIDIFTSRCGQTVIGHVDSSSWEAGSLTAEVRNRLSINLTMNEQTIQFAREAKRLARTPAVMVWKKLLIHRVMRQMNG